MTWTGAGLRLAAPTIVTSRRDRHDRAHPRRLPTRRHARTGSDRQLRSRRRDRPRRPRPPATDAPRHRTAARRGTRDARPQSAPVREQMGLSLWLLLGGDCRRVITLVLTDGGVRIMCRSADVPAGDPASEDSVPRWSARSRRGGRRSSDVLPGGRSAPQPGELTLAPRSGWDSDPLAHRRRPDPGTSLLAAASRLSSLVLSDISGILIAFLLRLVGRGPETGLSSSADRRGVPVTTSNPTPVT